MSYNPFDVILERQDKLERLLTELTQLVQPPIDKNTTLISRKDAATALKMSLPTLDSLIKDGAIKASRLGTRVLLRQCDVDDYVKAKQIKS